MSVENMSVKNGCKAIRQKSISSKILTNQFLTKYTFDEIFFLTKLVKNMQVKKYDGEKI